MLVKRDPDRVQYKVLRFHMVHTLALSSEHPQERTRDIERLFLSDIRVAPI